MKNLKEYIRDIPNFPKEGIIFHDITSILEDKDALRLAVNSLQEKLNDVDYDLIVGPESRGFIFGVPIAYNCNKPFIPIRKKGKLPCETISAQYELEYGTAELEMHKNAIKQGQKIVIVDDLLATGGTIEAIIQLVEKAGGDVVKILFLIELDGLKGRNKLKKYSVESIVHYDEK